MIGLKYRTIDTSLHFGKVAADEQGREGYR
jgi:hypothetical protein